ncbi:winged helix-turn-helix domain-containing protein [Kamptonema sp. PCC 6506]|uniref:winged helix-turn-helix domain-containing protein n=1 Tax=Kamptonema sp. PCC 6506 TaxID=272129 RepID=UPI0003046DC0|nr:winged helix-turn-helix domain-containing protein [Kamptonema sp. PCC 6506]
MSLKLLHLKILGFLKTPRRPSSVAQHFGLSLQNCHQILKRFEREGIVEIHWVEEKKFYQCDFHKLVDELKNQQ